MSGLRVRPAAVLLAAVAAAGCSHAPGVGPPAADVIAQAQSGPVAYVLVPVTPTVLETLARERPAALATSFADAAPAPIQTIGVGDAVSVTLWDSSGLFAAPQATPLLGGSGLSTSGAGGTGVTLPAQVVDQTGFVTIPFGGRVRVLGLSTGAAEQAVLDALNGKALQPQVLVTVVQAQSAAVTVAGDVTRPGRVPLNVAGTRLLDAVALSGGSTAPVADTAVQLTRGSVVRRVRLDSLVRDPAENIFLQNGDLLFLDRQARSVVVLGATNRNAEVAFTKPTLTLAESMGNGGGLADPTADPFGVFVFRQEPAEIARALAPGTLVVGSQPVPVVYQVDMQQPEGFFMAQGFAMRDRDVVYVANKPVAQLNKLIRTLSGVASVFNRSAVVSN